MSEARLTYKGYTARVGIDFDAQGFEAVGGIDGGAAAFDGGLNRIHRGGIVGSGVGVTSGQLAVLVWSLANRVGGARWGW